MAPYKLMLVIMSVSLACIPRSGNQSETPGIYINVEELRDVSEFNLGSEYDRMKTYPMKIELQASPAFLDSVGICQKVAPNTDTTISDCFNLEGVFTNYSGVFKTIKLAVLTAEYNPDWVNFGEEMTILVYKKTQSGYSPINRINGKLMGACIFPDRTPQLFVRHYFNQRREYYVARWKYSEKKGKYLLDSLLTKNGHPVSPDIYTSAFTNLTSEEKISDSH